MLKTGIHLDSRHLDHGYTYGWGRYQREQIGYPDRPHMVEHLHSSIQFYAPTYLRPYHWREMVPGCSVAIQTRSGVLLLRFFQPPEYGRISNRLSLMQALDDIEREQKDGLVVELLPGEVM